jgi:ATP-dependent helicase HrpA
MEIATVPVTLAELRERLPELMLRDQQVLGRRIDRAGQGERALAALGADIEAAAARAEARRRAVPAVGYPAELPVSQRREEIAAAIREHQVVIMAGETGSGKTTQLPKICLELGRGVLGQIGHTQPRRLAARTVAERIATELGTEIGGVVGYKVRFTDTSSDNTLMKVMTDGILLTELQHDRRLLRYDTIIIDEAHERSLNIDFILGYLHTLLPSRPDLKVIITSATIDPERFSKAFWDAPIVEVSGRSYPVEVRYRPLAPAAELEPDVARSEPRDQVQAVCDAIDELRGEGPGDILVFLSGEQEIRDTAEALSGEGYAELEVLPLYARLSSAEQHRVFAPHPGRRVVLATNVAETSLTVPGIKYVIDPGTARISRYSNRTKVQRLPIEPISQASANQRKGRCGRTSDGICIRLYAEDDFESRPEFTDPEILRTNLASVILRMTALDLGEVAGFPFLDPPDTRNVTDGVRLLTELGAIEQGSGAGEQRLTEAGRKLARLPVDPRLGRMIIEAGRNGCAREVLIITAALSIVDPRERPADAREAADALHRRFAEPGSDFLAFVRLWEYLAEQQRQLSGSAFRRMCRREYLHYLRVREWQDVFGQLRQAARELAIHVEPERRRPAVEPAAKSAPASGPEAHVAQLAARPGAEPERAYPAELADRVHKSLLAGLLSHIGMRDDSRVTARPRRGPAEFSGARGVRYALFPDSGLARRPPPWVVVAELMETSRLWGRIAARIEPEWAEALAPHLVRRTYSEPAWDEGRGAAVATEKVTLYGVPLVAARRVALSRVDPELARELFLRHALVQGEWHTRHAFALRNRQLLADAEELERRSRRRGIVPDDAALFRFYDSRIPADVLSGRHFDSWWKRAKIAEPILLDLTPALVAELAGESGLSASEVSAEDYPDEWGGAALSYAFAPGDPADGVTASIPLAALTTVRAQEFSWNVPGLREELVTELIRSLPKGLRTLFVPAPDVAREVLARLGEPAEDEGKGLTEALAAELGRIAGVPVPADAFDLTRLPPQLRMRFQITGDAGQVLVEGDDLAQLREQVRPALHELVMQAAAAEPGILTRRGIKQWDFDELPRTFRRGQVVAYPALADAGTAVDVVLFETAAEAVDSMLGGNRRLLMLAVPSGARAVASRLPARLKLALGRNPYGGVPALLDDCAAAAADEIIAAGGGPAWDKAAFEPLLDAARVRLAARTADVVGSVANVLAEANAVQARLDATTGPLAGTAMAPVVADVRAQLAGLVRPGFVVQAGLGRLADMLRYLTAIAYRMDKAPWEAARDAERMAVVHRVIARAEQVLGRLGPAVRLSERAASVPWMIEELRVSLFAQPLGTAFPVSEQRIDAALDRLEAG